MRSHPVTRRATLAGLAAGAATGLVTNTAIAQEWPAKPIRLVIPRAPGGGTDILTRILALGLQRALGQPIVVENKPDATAVVGTELVSRAEPDGYTLLMADNGFYQNPAVLESVPYDTLAAFTGITMLTQSPVILVAHPSLPAKNVKELIAHARASGGKVNYASGGIGSSTHLAGVMFNLKAGTSMLHVPFKSTGLAVNSLLGGHVNLLFGGISSARPQLEAGKILGLGLTGSVRDASVPDVPTIAEAGLPGVDVTSVWGVHGPAKLAMPIRRKVRDAFVAAMRESETAKKLADLGYHVIGNTPDEHQAQTEQLVRQWLEVGKTVNLRE